MSSIDEQCMNFAISKLVMTNLSRWGWLGSLKQAEGDFAVCEGGERDVRYDKNICGPRASY